MKTKLLISACLLGTPCRYDGKSKPCAAVSDLERYFGFILVCLEVDGGLPTPRPPAEIKDGRVYNSLGDDVTDEYLCGAEKAVRTARDNGCVYALLKARSPSCGNKQVYDGRFCNRLTDGRGITADALIKNGVDVFSEDEIDLLLSHIKL